MMQWDFVWHGIQNYLKIVPVGESYVCCHEGSIVTNGLVATSAVCLNYSF